MELVIPRSKNGEPFFRQIYKGMRQAILSGAFPAGERLPSTRDLAEQLGVSRTVVLLAYEQLLAEGFAEGRGALQRSPSLRVYDIGTIGRCMVVCAPTKNRCCP